MSLDDRDWWREDRRKKEELYGGDFSLNSKPIYKPLRDDTFTDIDYTLKPKRNSGNVTKIDILSAILVLSVWIIGLLIGFTIKFIFFEMLLCIAIPVLARHCRSVDKHAELNALLITFIVMMVIVFNFLGIFALLS